MSATITKRFAKKQAVREKRATWSSRVERWVFERMDLGESKVDRSACVIRGVKVLGKTSPNRHGLDVKGTDYTTDAMTKSAHLYEGINVNIGHPPRNDPDAERSPDDRNGTLFNVSVRESGMYADWQLIPSHPMTQRILDCAENPRLHSQFALSHNAKGQGEIREGRYRINDIPKVRSVDLVCDGGTNRSLFEGRENTMNLKPFKDHVAVADAKTQVILAPLLEMDEYGDMPTAAPEAKEGGEMGWKEHLGEMVKAILHEAELDDDAKIKKIMDAVELIRQEEEEGEKPAEGEAAKEDVVEEDEKEAEKDDKMESKERDELQRLRSQEKVRNLCESKEFMPNGLQLKALVGLPNDADRTAMIELFKTSKTPAPTKVKPSTGGARDVRESANNGKQRTKKEEFLAAVKR